MKSKTLKKATAVMFGNVHGSGSDDRMRKKFRRGLILWKKIF